VSGAAGDGSSKPSVERIERVSGAEAAYRAIRSSIASGRFEQGLRLTETRLSEDLGVSRALVREALNRLREEGLVVDQPYRGVHVRTFSVDDIVDIYNARIGLESVAARLIVRTGESPARLRELIEEMLAAARENDIPALIERELGFHQALCDLSGNRCIADLFRSISAQVQTIIGLDTAAYGDPAGPYGDPVGVARDHEPLVEAIEQGDEDLAVDRLVRHLVDVVPPLDRIDQASEEARARLLPPLARPAQT
jgi:GntR family transcriptional regulator, gluconate operon transcriptional repressor